MDILLAVLAVLPAVVLLCIIYKVDKVEKEPLGLMAAVFFFGALTTISAIILEYIGTWILDILFDKQNMLYLFLLNFFVIGVAEEAGKLFVLKKCTWDNEEFNYAFDGIVYSVCASLGFATIENIMYVGQFGLSVALMRAVLSVPGHCIFGVFMGTYYGLAKGYQFRGKNDKMKANMHKAFWIPVALHGLYDFCLSTEIQLLLLVFIGLEIFMVTMAIKYIKTISSKDLPLRPGFVIGQPFYAGNMGGQQVFQGAFQGQMNGNGQFMQAQNYQAQQFNANNRFDKNQYYQCKMMNGNVQYAQGGYYQGQVAGGQQIQARYYQKQGIGEVGNTVGVHPIRQDYAQETEDFKVVQSYIGYDNGPETEKLYDGICNGLTNPTPVFSASDFD